MKASVGKSTSKIGTGLNYVRALAIKAFKTFLRFLSPLPTPSSHSLTLPDVGQRLRSQFVMFLLGVVSSKMTTQI